jgi:hypothetical protein
MSRLAQPRPLQSVQSQASHVTGRHLMSRHRIAVLVKASHVTVLVKASQLQSWSRHLMSHHWGGGGDPNWWEYVLTAVISLQTQSTTSLLPHSHPRLQCCSKHKTATYMCKLTLDQTDPPQTEVCCASWLHFEVPMYAFGMRTSASVAGLRIHGPCAWCHSSTLHVYARGLWTNGQK